MGCPNWDLMTTILPLPNIFLYLLIKRATDVLSDICPCVFESISSCVKSTSGVKPFCSKIQVSPHDSISFPSTVIVITLDNS